MIEGKIGRCERNLFIISISSSRFSSSDNYLKKTRLSREEKRNQKKKKRNRQFHLTTSYFSMSIYLRSILISCVGYFKGALKPQVATFRETFPWVYRILRQYQPQTVYIYCTGGIRCTRLGAYLKSNKHLLNLPISPRIYSVSEHDRLGKTNFQEAINKKENKAL